MVLLGLAAMEFLIHGKIGDGEVQVTNHLFILNGLLLQLFADLLEHFNILSVVGDSLLVPGKHEQSIR